MILARGTRFCGVMLVVMLLAAPTGPARAQSGTMSLAAMTLDGQQMPQGYVLLSEGYRTAYQLAAALSASVDPGALAATGLLSQYTSYYVDPIGNTLRTYVFAYTTVDGVQRGFDLLETEPASTADATYQDLPVPGGIGEAPGEITVGASKSSDGTTSKSYDVTFRIDRFQVGVAEQRYDGAELQKSVDESLAKTLATRVTDV